MKEFWGLHPTIKIRLVMNFLGALCFSTVGGSMTIYYNKYMGAGITGLLLIVSSIMVFFGWTLRGTFDRLTRATTCHAFFNRNYCSWRSTCNLL